MRRLITHIGKAIVLTIFISQIAICQQNQNAISSARLIALPQPFFYIDVVFTNALATPNQDLTEMNVQITSVPALTVTSVNALGGSRSQVRVMLNGSPPGPEISTAKVCFNTLTFVETGGNDQTVSNVCSAVQVVNRSNAVSEKAQMLQELSAIPKTTSEKNIFASGFVATASTSTQGGVTLNLNSNDLGIKGMNVSLQTMKTSVAGGDPKNFDVGLNFNNAYVFGSADLDAIRQDLAILQDPTNPNRSTAATDIDNREANIQKKVLSAVLIHFSGNIEGEATNFNVANYVGDGDVALQSRTMTLFGTRKGFWQFRVVPFGVEGGKNVQNNLGTTESNSNTTEDFITRLKGGATLSLFYDDPQSVLPFKRLQLDLGSAQRYLLFKESEVTSVGAVPVSQDGYRPWYEASLLVYVAESSSGRYGFRLTYNNGSLPPTFTTTKSFQFGFVYESADDSKPASK